MLNSFLLSTNPCKSYRLSNNTPWHLTDPTAVPSCAGQFCCYGNLCIVTSWLASVLNMYSHIERHHDCNRFAVQNWCERLVAATMQNARTLTGKHRSCSHSNQYVKKCSANIYGHNKRCASVCTRENRGQIIIVVLHLWYTRVCRDVSAALAQVATQCSMFCMTMTDVRVAATKHVLTQANANRRQGLVSSTKPWRAWQRSVCIATLECVRTVHSTTNKHLSHEGLS